jgi:Tfp pilus assembly protein PilN
VRPLNLIPPEELRGDSAPLRAGPLSYALVGLLAAALLATVALVLTGNKINESKSEISALEARQVVAEQTSQGLSAYGNFATLSQTRNDTVLTLAQSRFDWERVLRELALVIPPDVTLQSLDGTATALSDGGDGTITGPSLAIGGCAEGQEGVARLLAALKDIDGVTRVGMQSSTIGEDDGDIAGPAPSVGDAAACPASSDVAIFSISVAFDAVPVAATPVSPDGTAAPAAAAPPTAPPSTEAVTAN